MSPAEALDQPGERVGQLEGFEVVINGLLGQKLQFERDTGRLTVFLEALAVRLGLLLGRAQELAGIGEQGRVEGLAALEQIIIHRLLSKGLLDRKSTRLN